MFSIKQKRDIANKIQKILRDTNHPELPKDEITFHIHIDGAENWSWADIKNNASVTEMDAELGKNLHNERQDWEDVLPNPLKRIFE